MRYQIPSIGGGAGGGTVWYTGTTAPSTLHNDGDFYLRTTNGDYYKQVSGSWGSPIGNLTGPAGSAGAAGQGLTWHGAYSGVTAYVPYDVVSYNGSSYICILASTGHVPTNTTYWGLMALSGAAAHLGDLLDVLLTSPVDGDVLEYNAGLSKWVNGKAAGFNKSVYVDAIAMSDDYWLVVDNNAPDWILPLTVS